MVDVLLSHQAVKPIPMRYELSFKDLRKRRGFTQASLAEALGVEQPTVQRWENGSRSPDIPQMIRLAEVLGVEPGELFNGTNIIPLGPRLFVKGEVAAGVWREAWEYEPDEWEAFTGRADISAPLELRFGLRIVGDSMDQLYPHGTIVECVYHPQTEPIPTGKRVVVQRKSWDQTYETTVKEYQLDREGRHWLVPRSNNPAFQAPFQIGEEGPDIEEVRVIAIVVASHKPE